MTSLKFYKCKHNLRSIEYTALKCIITFRSYNPNFSNQLSPFVTMHSYQASQELKTMCKTHFKMAFFVQKISHFTTTC